MYQFQRAKRSHTAVPSSPLKDMRFLGGECTSAYQVICFQSEFQSHVVQSTSPVRLFFKRQEEKSSGS